MHRVLLVGVLVCLAASAAKAQDPVKDAPEHYKVTFENERVRALKIHYGPHEKSAMHSHPDSVVILLTDTETRFTMPDGKTMVSAGKAGETMWTPAGTHSSENVSDKPFDGILVELRGKSMAAMAAKPATK